jgi:DNA-binding NtrC family response regulator
MGLRLPETPPFAQQTKYRFAAGTADTQEVEEMPEELNARVLLVDDEEKFLEVVSQRLKTRGLKVDTATSGEDALNTVRREDFDAIVLDLSMPGMSGLETLEKIRKDKPDVQVIILTGHGTLQAGVQAMKEGALDFMEKPVDLNKLLSRIDEARDKRILVVQKKHEEHLKEILQTKGW